MAEVVKTKATPSTDQGDTSRLFTLPPELRLIIYEYVFSTVTLERKKQVRRKKGEEKRKRKKKRKDAGHLPHAEVCLQSVQENVPLLHVCRLVRREALPIFDDRLDLIIQLAVYEADKKTLKAREDLSTIGHDAISQKLPILLEMALSWNCVEGISDKIKQMRELVGG